ncbi:MAG: sigma-E processing peptidase SpoIIGA [Oscillospiraceae bacterium]|nr:sigma-E processing peptidase SpoIIGA [Oscillospiraceae bacterium]
MTVVYLDSLIIINGLLNYLLLLGAARLAGEPLHRWRILLAALLGGGYAAAAVLPGFAFLTGWWYKIAVAVLMVLIGLGASRRLLRQIIIFFGLSFAFGGGVYAIALLGGRGLHLTNGVLHAGVDLKIVLLSAAGCYAVCAVFLRGIGRRNVASGEVVTVEVGVFEKQISFTALRDTGNGLTDPASGRGIVVVDWDVVLPLLEHGCRLCRRELSDPAGLLPILNTGRWRGRWGLIPYRAVGVACGMLLTLCPDRVVAAGRDCGRVRLALSPTAVSPGGGWRGLVGEGV